MKRTAIAFIFCLAFTIYVKAQTTVVDSIKAGGVFRTYRLYVPAKYNGTKPVPVVLNLHGLGSNATEQQYYGNFNPIADTAGFLVLLPNGTFDNGTGQRGWNNFMQPGTGVNDLGFLSALIDTISSRYNVDDQRIYSTGMSNGAFMSYDLACYLSNKIAAIASVTGSMISSHLSACDAKHPTPVMEIHGTADPLVSYAGNGGIVASTHIDSLVKYWVQFNNCSATPSVTQIPDIVTSDNCNAERQLFSGGTKGATVELYKITNGGHSWPGSPYPTSNGNTNEDFNASKEIWRFFSQYRLNQFTTGLSEIKNKIPKVMIYPNPLQDLLTVETDNIQINGIEVVNMLGQKVNLHTSYINANVVQINTSEWAPGVYLINIKQGDILFQQKLVK